MRILLSGGLKMNIFGIVLVAIALVLFLISIYFFNFAVCKKQWISKKAIGEQVTFSKEQKETFQKGVDWFFNQKVDRVSFKNPFDETYYADLIQNGDSKKFIILIHGYRASALKNFAPILEKYYNMGFSILMPELPAHGQSYGKYITFGYMESAIMLAWSYYLMKNFGRDISIVYNGVSMGAATAAMIAGERLNENVKGIIVDCGYTSAKDIFKYILKKDFHLPAFPIVNLANAIANIVADFSFDDADALEAVKKATVPMIFFHGTKDKFVPYEMSIEMYNACTSEIKELVLIEGAGHCMSYLTDTKTCDTKLDEFLNRIL